MFTVDEVQPRQVFEDKAIQNPKTKLLFLSLPVLQHCVSPLFPDHTADRRGEECSVRDEVRCLE